MNDKAEPVATLQTQTDWQPNSNYLMLEPILLPEVSEGGIILPGDVYRKTNRGLVMKQGPSVDPASPFRPGVEVFFPANTDYTIEVEGASVYLVRETDIIMFRSQSQS